MLTEGINLAMIGMSTVFIFLSLVIIFINCMTRIVKLLPQPANNNSANKQAGNIPEEIAVVIAAAKAFSKEEKR
ncbi:MAG: OadG family protein [Candidatus Rifleibacteriota bacterium]